MTLERLRNAGISEQLSVQNRVVTARIGLEAFVNAPILGWGPENFAIAFQRYEKPGDFNTSFLSDQAHNRLIDELTTTGVLGFVVYVLLWGRMGQILYRRIRAHPEEDLFTVLLGAGLVAYFVQNLFLFDAHATYLQALLLIGWLASTEVRLQAAATERAAPATQDGGGRRRARPSQRQAAGGWWAYGPAGRLVEAMSHGPDLRWMGGVSLVVILTASLYFTVYRPFQAAQLFPTQLSGRGELIVWEEFWANAGESFSTFPPLATLPRQVLFDTLITNWRDRQPVWCGSVDRQSPSGGDGGTRGGAGEPAAAHISGTAVSEGCGDRAAVPGARRRVRGRCSETGSRDGGHGSSGGSTGTYEG